MGPPIKGEFESLAREFIEAVSGGYLDSENLDECGLCGFCFLVESESRGSRMMPSHKMEVGQHAFMVCHHCKHSLVRAIVKSALGSQPCWQRNRESYLAWITEEDHYRSAPMNVLTKQNSTVTAEWLVKRLRKRLLKMEDKT